MICKKCNIDKPLTEFYQTIKKDGTIFFRKDCKSCVRIRNRKYISEHPDVHKKNRKSYESKPERIEYLKQSIKRQRESGYTLKWLKENPDKVKSYNEKRQHKNHKINTKEWESCKKYFNHRCAYCGLKIEEHYFTRKGITKLMDFHKEHVDHQGSDGLENCIPSCKTCNSSKHTSSFKDWYNNKNIIYSEDKFNKITQWLNEDFKKYVIKKKVKQK